MSKRIGAAALCLGLIGSVHAVAPVEVVALFKDRAMVRTTGGEHLLRIGETSPDGVTLLTADATNAEVTYKGERYDLSLSRRVSGNFQEVERTQISISPDHLGQYRITGTINGSSAGFLVDTGASVVAMSADHARSLSINFTDGQKGAVQTAQGTADSYFINLDQVAVGGIRTYNVQAAVIEGSYPTDILLGMSFLRQVKMEEQGGVLTLVQKH